MNKYLDMKKFRKDVEKALSDVAKQYGVSIEAGNIRYSSNDLTLQLKATRSDKDVQKEKFLSTVNFMPGFAADDYLRKVKIDKHTFIINGFKPGNKYDVELTRDDGKMYVYTSASVLAALGRN